MILKVPYYSQVGFGADEHFNDCGPACCSMCLAYVKDISVSPNDWYDIDGWGAPDTDVGTYAWQMRKALAEFDVDSFQSGYLLAQEEQPIISLVDYGVLSRAGYTWVKASFLHWVVIVGRDVNHIVIHDPYYPEEQGANIRVSYGVFNSAFRWSNIAVIKPPSDERPIRKPGDRLGKPERMQR